MAYFQDLSEYVYLHRFRRPGTKNIGWLDLTHEFMRATPSDDLLTKIWNFCKISTAQTRGLHSCEVCGDGKYTDRNGEKLLLGSSEIRVFSEDGTIYAAPTLIYHYISAHNYCPPSEFLAAVNAGPAPPSQAYFDRLRSLDLEHRETSAPSERPRRFIITPKGKEYFD